MAEQLDAWPLLLVTDALESAGLTGKRKKAIRIPCVTSEV